MKPASAKPRLTIDEHERTVMWWIAGAAPGQRATTPWGTLILGEYVGAGQLVLVSATEAFLLVVHDAGASYAEPIEPGTHRLVLTLLDRTDVTP